MDIIDHLKCVSGVEGVNSILHVYAAYFISDEEEINSVCNYMHVKGIVSFFIVPVYLKYLQSFCYRQDVNARVFPFPSRTKTRTKMVQRLT